MGNPVTVPEWTKDDDGIWEVDLPGHTIKVWGCPENSNKRVISIGAKRSRDLGRVDITTLPMERAKEHAVELLTRMCEEEERMAGETLEALRYL